MDETEVSKYVDISEYPFEALEKSDPKQPIVLDTETAGHTDDSHFVIYYSWAAHDLGSGAGPTTTRAGFDFLNAVLRSPRPKVFHNITADLYFLHKTGLKVGGKRGYCTLLAHALLDEYHPSHEMLSLVEADLGKSRPDYYEVEVYKKGVKNKAKKNLYVPQRIFHRYSVEDAVDTLGLWDKYVPRLINEGLWDLYEVTMDAEMTWYQMELDGIEFDSEAAEEALMRIDPIKEIIGEQVQAELGERFLITSHQQLGRVLSKHFPLRKNENGNFVTDLEELRKHRQDRRIQLVLAYKKLAGASSKIRNRIEEGSHRLYGEYKQVLVTGRSSISGVPLQQIAKRAGKAKNIIEDVGDELIAEHCAKAYQATRKMWIPKPGSTLVTYDYDQGEYRAAAHYTGSERLISLMQDPEADFHEITCRLVFGESNEWLRDIIKHVNFGLLYGMGVAGIERTISKLSGKDLSEFTTETPTSILKRYERELPEMRQFQQDVLRWYNIRGYVSDVFGRRYRTLPNWFKRLHKTDDYAIINYLCQGTVANIKRHALAKLGKLLGVADTHDYGGVNLKSRIATEIHDEIVFEIVPEESWLIHEIHKIMTDFPMFSVPFTCSPNVGENLLDVKEMTLDEATAACADGRFIRKAA